jgi:hypothetical protein
MGFTFKKEPAETGLRAVGYPNPNTVIKFEKLPVGLIVSPCWSSKDYRWRIQLRVSRQPTTDDPCEFRNVYLKTRFETEPEARVFLQKNFDAIVALGLCQDKE